MVDEIVSNVNTVEVTWMHAIKVWWSFTWRMLAYGFIGGFIIGLFLGFIMAMMGANEVAINNACRIAGFIIGIPIGIAVVKIVLQKRYSDFRIALLSE